MTKYVICIIVIVHESLIYVCTQDEFDPSTSHHRATEEWMLICHRNADFTNSRDCDEDHDWSASSSAYPNLEELPTFITRRQSAQQHVFTTTADPTCLQGKQLATYRLVQQHSIPLRMIISGTAGTGKSYLIHFCKVAFLG